MGYRRRMHRVQGVALAHRQAPQCVRKRPDGGRRLRAEPRAGQLQQESGVLRREASSVAQISQRRRRLDRFRPSGVARVGVGRVTRAKIYIEREKERRRQF